MAMLLTPAWTTLRPHKAQSDLWRCRDRYQACRAGRRSGKTTLYFRKLVRALAEKVSHIEAPRYLYLGPTREQAKNVAWQPIKSLLHSSYLACAPNETELTITTIWGSTLKIGGFDKPMRYEGVGYDGVVVDESSDIKPRAVDLTILPALADRKGWLARIGVPKRTGIGAPEFKRICEDRSKGYTLFEWSAEEILDPAEIANLANRLDIKDFQEQVQGKAVASGGLAYYAFEPKHYPLGNLLASEVTKYDPARTIVVGSDFNVNPMAWVLCHVFNGVVSIFDEIWLRDTNTRQTLNELYRRYPEHKAGWLFLGDATGQARKTAGVAASNSDYLIIKNDSRFANTPAGVRCCYPAKNPLVKDRLASVNAMLCNAKQIRRIVVNPACIHLIEDLSTRQLAITGAPIGANSDSGHITDALGYVIYGMFPIQLLSEDYDLLEVSAGGIEFVPESEQMQPVFSYPAVPEFSVFN